MKAGGGPPGTTPNHSLDSFMSETYYSLSNPQNIPSPHSGLLSEATDIGEQLET
jgi:hypothetical protein